MTNPLAAIPKTADRVNHDTATQTAPAANASMTIVRTASANGPGATAWAAADKRY